MNSYIIATGASLPERSVANKEIAHLLEVEPDFIEAHSGIKERRWVAADQSASDLAVGALRGALNAADIAAERIDYLIGGTLSPDYQVPGIAPIIQRKLASCRDIPALDVRVGCAAILYSLQMARALTVSGAAELVACVGAEAQSKGLSLNRSSAELSMLFGDGGGALLVTGRPEQYINDRRVSLRIDDIVIHTDGNYAEELIVRAPGTANGARWLDPEQIGAGYHEGTMQGRTLILQAVRKLSESAGEIVKRNGIALEEIDLIVPHQANLNLLRSLCKRLGYGEERVVVNLDRYGNTSGASAFLALDQAWREERLRPNKKVMILAFGAGFTWGAALCTVC